MPTGRTVAGWYVSLAAVLSSSLLAQSSVMPSAHWGATAFPETGPGTQLGIHFDRFTEFGENPSGDKSTLFIPYNNRHATIGLNFLAVATTRRLGRLLPNALYRITLQVGYSGEQPNRFFQNQVIHVVRAIDTVPVGRTRSAFEAGAGADLAVWTQVLDAPAFVGAGGGVSTLFQEAFLDAGVRHLFCCLSLLVRGGVVRGADAFPDRVLRRWNGSAMVTGRLPLDRWTARLPMGLLIPEVELGYSRTTGLFASRTGAALPEEYCTLRLTWSPVTLESWNDLCGHKDKGPTYGVRLFIQTAVLGP